MLSVAPLVGGREKVQDALSEKDQKFLSSGSGTNKRYDDFGKVLSQR